MASPDGRMREVWGYNEQLPGPLIRVKLGTRARIRVENGLNVPTSIHWHGFHQHGTPTMDGVEGVSREPIAPGKSFVYDFVAEPAGTHGYHSHVGVRYVRSSGTWPRTWRGLLRSAKGRKAPAALASRFLA
jgi:multicopper oxidase